MIKSNMTVSALKTKIIAVMILVLDSKLDHPSLLSIQRKHLIRLGPYIFPENVTDFCSSDFWLNELLL